MVVSLFFSRTLGFRKSHVLKSPKLDVVYVWLPGKSNPAIGGGGDGRSITAITWGIYPEKSLRGRG